MRVVGKLLTLTCTDLVSGTGAFGPTEDRKAFAIISAVEAALGGLLRDGPETPRHPLLKVAPACAPPR